MKNSTNIKSTLLLLLLNLLLTAAAYAQAPQGFNYQATVRNSSGALMVSQNVTFKFNIIKDAPTSVPVFSETHYAPTDDLGAVNLFIGKGTPTIGTFESVDWGNGNYYLGIELNTGSGYVAMGTTQLLSVPFALYANSAGASRTLGKPTILITGNITNEEAAAQIAKELGPQTDNIYIINTSGLSIVDLSTISNLTNLFINENENLTTINLKELVNTFQVMSINSNPMLTSLSFPAFKIAAYGEFQIDNNATLTSISFPILNKIIGAYIKINNPLLSSIAIPMLTSIKGDTELYISSAKLSLLIFPALTSCSKLKIYSGDFLTSISFPALNTIESLTISGNKSLSSIGIPSLVTANSINFENNSLINIQVNSLLNKLLSINPSSGKNINIEGQTPFAPPTGQGIMDKATLINTGNNVVTD